MGRASQYEERIRGAASWAIGWLVGADALIILLGPPSFASFIIGAYGTLVFLYLFQIAVWFPSWLSARQYDKRREAFVQYWTRTHPGAAQTWLDWNEDETITLHRKRLSDPR